MDAELSFLDPDDLPEPDTIAVGGWTCGCGLLTFSDVKGSIAVTILPQCPQCGEVAEILALDDGALG